ncbi:hypothetical protein [Nocardioides alcanivorans]|uniref:hypothetical protein n=1 Tax=Nocardioides alcanivorans TaxID=2897352 RepID=UPI001F2A7806|nr:hypothetical protein [Nocardioides alcanivorans]
MSQVGSTTLGAVGVTGLSAGAQFDGKALFGTDPALRAVLPLGQLASTVRFSACAVVTRSVKVLVELLAMVVPTGTTLRVEAVTVAVPPPFQFSTAQDTVHAPSSAQVTLAVMVVWCALAGRPRTSFPSWPASLPAPS